MKCFCQKSFCKNKVCKCRKFNKFCTEKCGCSTKCNNRSTKVTESKSEAADSKTLQTKNLCSQAIDILSKVMDLAETNIEMPEELIKLVRSIEHPVNEMGMVLNQMQMERVSINDQLGEGEMLSEEQWKKFTEQLISCEKCSRKFIPKRIKVHEAVCKKNKEEQN